MMHYPPFRIRIPLATGILALLVFFGCRSAQPQADSRPTGTPPPAAESSCFPVETLASAEDRRLARQLVKEGLDHEALYTLAAEIKPISSVEIVEVPVSPSGGASDSLWASARSSARSSARRYARVAEALECGDVHALLVPFRHVRDGERLLQLYFVNGSRLADELGQQPDFWMQWGFAPKSAPGVVVTTVENDSSYARFRGYGHLFGYPDHAVDFFTDAARQADQTGTFVERDFFQIPTHARATGHFVYAIPKDYRPANVDSSLYRRAQSVLKEYRRRRPAYVRPDSTLRSIQLIRDWKREQASDVRE